MAGLFAVLSLAMAAVLFKQRVLAIVIVSIGILLSLLMFWHHATDILKINW